MIEKNIIQFRKRIIELAHKAGKNGAHVGGSLSCIDSLTVLFSLMNKNPEKLEERDRFILSKGHAALALYCILENESFLTKEEVETFEANGTSYFAHAKRNIEKGIEFSGGSLSLGMTYAVGVALACKNKNVNNKVYVLLGDGECNEGLVWEAAMSAANFKLDNLIVIVDVNGIQSDGFTKDVLNAGSLKEKFEAFGFNAVEIDGHSVYDLKKAFSVNHQNQPYAIIAKTVKGHGVELMENDRKWHHGVVTDDVFLQAISDIEKNS